MNRQSNRRALAAGVTVAALSGSLLTACGAAGDEVGATSCEGAKVSAGVVSSISDALLFIAADKGYFEDEGLDVDLTAFDSAAKMIPSLGSGQLDVGAGAPSAGFYNAVGRDIAVRIVADKGELVTNYDYMPILVRTELVESGKVKTVADLKGLKAAEPAQGTSTASTLAAVLESGGLSYDDVEHEYLGFADQVAAFANGSIDLATTTEPAATKILAEGTAVRFADSTEVYNEQQLAVLLYSGDFGEERKAAAQCFMNAYAKAAADYRAAVEGGTWTGEGAEDVVAIVAEHTGLAPEVVKQTVPAYVSDDARVNVDSLQRDYDFFADQGWIEGDAADLQEIVDTTWVDQVEGGE